MRKLTDFESLMIERQLYGILHQELQPWIDVLRGYACFGKSIEDPI